LLKGVLGKVLGAEVRLVDSSEACADALKATESGRVEKGELKIFLTDEPGAFLGRVESFLGKGAVASIERIHLPHG
jgi:glutamate racemase